jgi:hypothetical protein
MSSVWGRLIDWLRFPLPFRGGESQWVEPSNELLRAILASGPVALPALVPLRLPRFELPADAEAIAAASPVLPEAIPAYVFEDDTYEEQPAPAPRAEPIPFPGRAA